MFEVTLWAIASVSCGCLALHGWRQRKRAEASDGWPRVTGTVISVRSKDSTDGEASRVVIEYQYEVAGTGYIGKRISFGNDWGSDKQLKEDLALYQPRAAVTVYFNPAKPSNAVLRREAPGSGAFILGGLLLALFFGACGIATALGVHLPESFNL